HRRVHSARDQTSAVKRGGGQKNEPRGHRAHGVRASLSSSAVFAFLSDDALTFVTVDRNELNLIDPGVEDVLHRDQVGTDLDGTGLTTPVGVTVTILVVPCH